MEKVKLNSFFLIWKVLGLIALCIIWFLPWRFQTNDDEIMMWLVSGAYTGTPESYAVFIHPLLSWTFSKLYTFAPTIPWYPLTWYLVIYLSYLALITSLGHSKRGTNEKNFLTLFCLFLLLHFALFLQFTIVAGISGFAGLLLFQVCAKNRINGLYIFSTVLCIFSILIRWESFVLILLGLGFYHLSFSFKRRISEYSKPILVSLILVCILVASKMLWEKHSEYADFVQYNQARAAVSDHPANHILREGDIKGKSNWFYFSQWMMEGNTFSVEKLEAKKDELDKEFFTLNQVSNSLIRLFFIMRMEAFKSVFAAILVGIFFYSFRGSKSSLLFIVTWIVFFLVFNHFFVLNGRVVILFFLPLLFPLALESFRNFLGRRTFYLASSILIVLFGYHLYNFLREAEARKVMDEEFLSLTANVPAGSLILMEGYKENYLGIKYSMAHPVPFLSLGWISSSPYQQKRLKKLGIDNIAEAKEYYLLGVDINEEFYFPEYMNFLGGGYELESKIEKDNFILFHYNETR
tara:strand:+ start:142 stop:1704 length:1563 start_codon:yes stop_codon:yes gene_type:complete